MSNLGTLAFHNLRIDIASSEITGVVNALAENDRNVDEPSDVSMRWSIEIRGEPYRLVDPETGEDYGDIEPVFLDQYMPAQVRDWRALEGSEFAFEAATADPENLSHPSLHIGGGDVLPTSNLRIGRREGNSFDLDWRGICYANLDEERDGLTDFHITGRVLLRSVTVMVIDDGSDVRAFAERMLAACLDPATLHFVEERRPYANGDDPLFARHVHLEFAPSDPAY